MRVIIESSDIIHKHPELNMNSFGQVVLTIGGVDVPFMVVSQEVARLGGSSPFTLKWTDKTIILEEIAEITIETEEMVQARNAVEKAKDSLAQAEKVYKTLTK